MFVFYFTRCEGGKLVVHVDVVRECPSAAATNRPIAHAQMSVEPKWNDTDRRKSKNSEKNQSQYHFKNKSVALQALTNLGPAEQLPLAVFPDCTRR
jgi:hypothetical protein